MRTVIAAHALEDRDRIHFRYKDETTLPPVTMFISEPAATRESYCMTVEQLDQLIAEATSLRHELDYPDKEGDDG